MLFVRAHLCKQRQREIVNILSVWRTKVVSSDSLLRHTGASQ